MGVSNAVFCKRFGRFRKLFGRFRKLFGQLGGSEVQFLTLLLKDAGGGHA